MLESDDTSYEVSGAIADVVQASAEFQSSSGVEHGVILSSGSAVSRLETEQAWTMALHQPMVELLSFPFRQILETEISP
jgi:hypothetical protein